MHVQKSYKNNEKKKKEKLKHKPEVKPERLMDNGNKKNS